jgi:CRISPR system Cascade subunit CasA
MHRHRSAIQDAVPGRVKMGFSVEHYLDMAKRAEAILIDAFESGPRSGEQRYRARAAALSRLRGGLRSEKTLPTLAQHYKTLKDTKETTHVQP